MSNVRAFPGCVVENEPVLELVSLLRQLTAKAESGELRSFVGTGFMHNGTCAMCLGDFSDDPYRMLGALSVLRDQYVEAYMSNTEDTQA